MQSEISPYLLKYSRSPSERREHSAASETEAYPGHHLGNAQDIPATFSVWIARSKTVNTLRFQKNSIRIEHRKLSYLVSSAS